MEAKVGLTQVNTFGQDLNKRSQLHHDFPHATDNNTTRESRHTHSDEAGNGLKVFSKLVVCTACGVVFGIAADKGQVHVPSVIINQMLFSQFTMLKMFLSAVASSAVVFSLLSALPLTKRFFEKINSSFHRGLQGQYLVKTAVGAIILGAGMTMCGSCPGMVLVQVGSFTQNAVFTLSGCMVGAMLYGVLDPYFPKHTKANYHIRIPHLLVGLPLALMMGSIVMTVEYFVPWTSEVQVIRSSSIMSQKAWNPAIAGTLIGLIQIPIVFSVGDTLGGSSAYCTAVSRGLSATGFLSDTTFQYFKKFRRGMDNWWQVFYVTGAIAGGYISANMSSSVGTAIGVSPLSAFLGGMCLLFGARMSSGCTSGHGISGMGLLAVHSIVATPCIFIGGIATAILSQYLP